MKFGQLYLIISGLRLESEHGMLPQIQLSPMPQYIEYKEGLLCFQKKIKISTNLDERFDFITKDFISELTTMSSLKLKSNVQEENEVVFDFTEFSEIVDGLSATELDNFLAEGYVLQVDSSAQEIGIYAESPRGIFYALQTVYQILACNKKNEHYLQALTVLDYPDMKIRGLSDDVSRGQAATIDGLKKYIHELAKFKLNYYFLYVEDVIKFSRHPSIGKNRGAYDAKDIRRLTEYARKHFMEFTLVFESLGHMDNILSLPDYHKYAEFPSSDCLNIADDRIYKLLEDLYEELYKTFGVESLHVGCDESWELGEYRSRKYVKEVGKSSVYKKHYNSIYKLARKAGFRNIFIYHDIAIKFKEVLQNVPEDYIFVFWKYSDKEKYPDLDKLTDAGFKTVVSPAVQDWSRFFPDMAKMEGNTFNIISYGLKKGSIGVIQSSWGDFRNEQLRQRIYGFAYASSVAWNVKKFSSESFWTVFFRTYFGIRKSQNVEAFKEVFSMFNRFYSDKILGGKENFPRLWAHPYGYYSKQWPNKGYQEALPQIEQLITKTAALKGISPVNKLNIEMLNYSARLYRVFAKKMLISHQIAHDEKKVNKADLVWLRDEFQNLKGDYERLWAAECSIDNLKPILSNYNAITGFLDQKIEQLENSVEIKKINIPSQWIYYCKRKHRGYPLETFFRKKITIRENLKYAKIQLIGDTHIRVYLNGNLISEFFSKRTLSVRMLNNMVKIIDLTQYLKKSDNYLVVENVNYQGGFGIINVFGEIAYTNGCIENIVSDKSWIATNTYNRDWIKGNSKFLPMMESNNAAKELGKPPLVNGALSFPDFINNVPSHHTSHLGLGSEALRYIPIFLKFLAKFLSKKMYKHGAVL